MDKYMDNLWIIHGQSIVYCCNHSSLPKRSQEDIESIINHHLIFFVEVMNFQRALHVGIHFDNKKRFPRHMWEVLFFHLCWFTQKGPCKFSKYLGKLIWFDDLWGPFWGTKLGGNLPLEIYCLIAIHFNLNG